MTVKRFFLLSACFCAGLFFSGCSKNNGAASSGPGPDASGVYEMKIGHAQTKDSPRHRSLLLFKKLVEEKSDGKIHVSIYPDAVLGNENEMTVAVSQGQLQAVRGGDLEFVPKITALGLPMIADSLEDARRICYSTFVEKMLPVAASSNMKVLAVGDDSGFRQITNNVRPIVTPSDLKGLKIRAPQIVATEQFLNELGAVSTVVPFNELYDVLAGGKADGQENPLALIDSSRFYEVQKYCTIINYQFFPELMYVNLAWWNSLPEDCQAILTECSRIMMEENARITDEENEAYIRHIQQEGVEIIELTPEQRSAFIPYAEHVWQNYVEEGYFTKEELNEMLAIAGKHIEWQ